MNNKDLEGCFVRSIVLLLALLVMPLTANAHHILVPISNNGITFFVPLNDPPPAGTISLSGDVGSADGDVDLSWSGATGQVSDYEIVQTDDEGTETTLTVGAVTSYTVTGLSKGGYTFKVRACNKPIPDDCTGYSNDHTSVVSIASTVASVPGLTGGGADAGGTTGLTTDFHGIVAGSHDVGSAGDARYTIPLNVPPGTNGMAPNLSLNYSSNSGSGILGRGWSVGGTGAAIARCPQTIAQDGAPRAVDYTSSDKYCLNGQRLVLDSGTYGAAGSEYRTELDSFTKITAVGSAGSGPASFEVLTKDGLKTNYGSTADSRIEASAPNNGEVGAWLISKVEDRYTNYYEYNYIEDNTNGDSRLDSIDYTGNTDESVVPYGQVKFNYEDNPDIVARYYLGSVSKRMKRLSSVTMKMDLTPDVAGVVLSDVREYVLEYDDTPMLGGSKVLEAPLVSVKLCASNASGICTPKTTFDWGGDALLITNSGWFGPSVETAAGSINQWVDFNGDGRMDYVTSAPTSASHKVGLSSGTNYVTATWTAHAQGTTGFETFVDINGDGLVDHLTTNTDGTHEIAFSNGSGYDLASGGSWTAFASSSPDTQQMADMDGDSRHDYIVTVGSTHYVSFSQGNGYRLESGSNRYQSWTGPDLSTATYSFHDVNSDGRADLVIVNGTTHEIYINNGSGYDVMVSYTAHSSSDETGEWADLNGDGLLDFVTIQLYTASTPEKHFVSLWTGKNYVTSDWAVEASFPNYWGAAPTASVFSDMNGDGYTDHFRYSAAAHQNGGTVIAYVNFSDGTQYGGLGGYGSPTFNSYDGLVGVIDLNGDGKPDTSNIQLGGYYNSTAQKVGSGYTDLEHVMSGITNGNGVTTTITYKHLTDSSVYSKGTNTYGNSYDDYPILDVVNAVNVVSQVTQDNGVGGQLTTNYQYEGLKFDREGRGSLGFSKVIIEDIDQKTRVETEFRQDYPFVGLVSHTELTVTDKNNDGTTGDEQLLTMTDTTYVEQTGADGHPFVCKDTETRELYELSDGRHLSTTTTDNDPDGTGSPCDGFGNIVKTTLTVTDRERNPDVVHKSETTWTVTNNTQDWLLGQASNTVVKTYIDGLGDSGKFRTTAFTYKPEGTLATAVREPSGSAPEKLTATYGYDAFGNRNSESVSATDITTRTESVAYDVRGRFAETLTNAEGHTTKLAYDERFGTVDRIEGANYNGGSGVPAATRTFDDFGRLIQEDRPDGSHSLVSYKEVDHTSSPVGISDRPEAVLMVETTVVDDPATPNMQFTPVRAFLDAHGRQVRQRVRGFDASDYLNVDTFYDDRGRILKRSNPYHDDVSPVIRWTTPTYDVLNRTTGVIAADETANSTAEYDGFDITLTDAVGRTQLQTRSALGQVLQSHEDEPNGIGYLAITDFEYDTVGNLIRSVKLDATQGEITKTVVTNQYDRLGRRTRTIDPDAGQIDFTYLSTGELKTQQTPRLASGSDFLTMTYDKLGRPKTRVEPDDDFNGSVTSTWTYDDVASGNAAKGRLTSETIGTAHTRDYFYDATEAGRLTQTTTTIGTSVYDSSITYDALGRVESIAYPSSPSYTNTPFTVTYAYNPRGYLERVTDTAASDVFYQTTAVNAEGQITADYLGDGSLTNQGFAQGSGRKIYTNAARPDGGAGTEHIQNFSYTYDAIGNMQTRSDLLQDLAETFEYDAINRLTKATVDGGTTTTVIDYDYDGLGNLTDKTDLSTMTGALKFDEAGGVGPHAVTKLDTGSTTINFGYDANGNLTSGDPGNNGRTITYTSYDKALKITQGASIREFAYAADRSRYQQIHNDGSVIATTNYVGRLYTEETNNYDSDEIHKHTIFANGQAVAIHVDTDDGSPSTATKFLHRDHLGSITSIVDGSGIEHLSYDAFGKRRDATDWVSAASTPSEARGYTAHEHLDDVGIIHMNGRIYDPSLGRMMSPDPILQDPLNSQNWNRYSYVLNNPLRFTDPSGFAIVYCGTCPTGPPGPRFGSGQLNGSFFAALPSAVRAHVSFGFQWASTGGGFKAVPRSQAPADWPWWSGNVAWVPDGPDLPISPPAGTGGTGTSNPTGPTDMPDTGSSPTFLVVPFVGGVSGFGGVGGFGGTFAGSLSDLRALALSGSFGSLRGFNPSAPFDPYARFFDPFATDLFAFEDTGFTGISGSDISNGLTGAGGFGQISAGVILCGSVGGCIAGIPLIVLGISNVGESATGFDSPDGVGFSLTQGALESGFRQFNFENPQRLSAAANGVLNLTGDLAGLNAPSLVGGGFKLFRHIPTDFAALKFQSTRSGVILNSASTINTTNNSIGAGGLDSDVLFGGFP